MHALLNPDIVQFSLVRFLTRFTCAWGKAWPTNLIIRMPSEVTRHGGEYFACHSCARLCRGRRDRDMRSIRGVLVRACYIDEPVAISKRLTWHPIHPPMLRCLWCPRLNFCLENLTARASMALETASSVKAKRGGKAPSCWRLVMYSVNLVMCTSSLLKCKKCWANSTIDKKKRRLCDGFRGEYLRPSARVSPIFHC